MAETISLANIKSEIDQLWRKNDDGKNLETNCKNWASIIIDGIDDLEVARKSFYQPEPLRAYTCIADLKKAIFSLRFKGQTVGYLKNDRFGVLKLHIDSKLKKANSDYFGYKIDSDESSWNWRNDVVAKEFRAYFKDKYKISDGISFLPRGSTKTASEHNVESLILKEMQRTDSGKFGGTCLYIQPVMVAGCPLQCPLPISSSKGKIRPNKGNIDILARTKNRNLSVWELKKPMEDLKSLAHIQVFAYAYTLLKMLRSESGSAWYKIFGFNSDNVPSSLTIEAVPVFSVANEEKKRQIANDLKNFIAANASALQCGQDKIQFRLAFYDFGIDDKPRDPRSVVISNNYSFETENIPNEKIQLVEGNAAW